MRTICGYVGWLFWAKWLLANILGWATAWAIFYGFGYLALIAISGAITALGFRESDPIAEVVFGILFGVSLAIMGALVGVLLGIVQRFVLRQHMSLSSRWELAHGVGLAVGGIVVWLMSLVSQFSNPEVLCLTGLVMAWASMVIAQWFVLRQQSSPPARWVFVNAVNLAVSGLGAIVVTYPLLLLAFWTFAEGSPDTVVIFTNLAIIGAIGGVVGGAIGGSTTGFVLRAFYFN